MKLLYENEYIVDKYIERAVRLALARRVGSPYQEAFIAEFYAHPTCSNYFAMGAEYTAIQKGQDLLHAMKFIGSPQTIVVLLNIFIIAPDKPTKPKYGSFSVSEFPPDVARQYLKGIGFDMPAGLNQQQRSEWWNANKEAVLQRLGNLNPLPEIQMPGISVTIS